jgi:hypothetical protein
MAEDFSLDATDFILDAKNFIFDCRRRKTVAMIRNGQVFRNDKEETRIAVFVGSNLYDVNGNFLGRLDGCSRSLPIAFRELLEDNPKALRAVSHQDPPRDQSLLGAPPWSREALAGERSR